MELIFEVRDADESGFCARALGHAIFTEAETWPELRWVALAYNVRQWIRLAWRGPTEQLVTT